MRNKKNSMFQDWLQRVADKNNIDISTDSLKNIVSDGKPHDLEKCVPACEYILDLNKPRAGILRCRERDIEKKWLLKANSIPDEIARDDKIETMEELLRDYMQLTQKAKPDENVEGDIRRLANLSIFEYEHIRKAEAARFKIRLKTLDSLVIKERRANIRHNAGGKTSEQLSFKF